MTTSDFTNLTRISNSNQPVRTPTGDVFFNAAGTREGPISGTGVNGNTEVVDCVPVSIDGTELTGDAAAVNSNISDISGKAPSLSFDKIPFQPALHGIYCVLQSNLPNFDLHITFSILLYLLS